MGKIVLIAGLLALFALVSAVSAETVITFDDLSGSSTLSDISYAGMSWDPQWFYWDGDQSPAYVPHSGLERIATHNYGGWFSFSHPVEFKGAWFSGNGEAATSCYFEGYNNNVLVGTSASHTMTYNPTFLNAGFSGKVDKVNLVCDNYNFFAVDDITYEDEGTAVPEFPVAAVPAAMIVGLLGAVLVIRSRDN